MRSLSSKVKSVFKRLDIISQALRRLRSSGNSILQAKAEPSVLTNDGDSDWLELDSVFTSRLTSTISVLYKHFDAFYSIAGDFIDELTTIHNRSCNQVATFAADMRKLNSKGLRACYDFEVVKELAAPLEAVKKHQSAVKVKLERLQAPIDPDALITSRLTNVLEIYDLFVASYQQLESGNEILTRARRLTARLVPIEVQKTSEFTLKLLFDTCYNGVMILTKNWLVGIPDMHKLLNLRSQLREWGVSIFDSCPVTLDELFALDPERTNLYREMLVLDFLRILVFVD